MSRNHERWMTNDNGKPSEHMTNNILTCDQNSTKIYTYSVTSIKCSDLSSNLEVYVQTELCITCHPTT